MLYATETFESYNLVIRLRSVNSNRHAPSLDIARSFNHLHAVRHLVSGGYVMYDEDGEPGPPRQAGKRVLELINDVDFTGMMGMAHLRATSHAGQPLNVFPIRCAIDSHYGARFLPSPAFRQCNFPSIEHSDIPSSAADVFTRKCSPLQVDHSSERRSHNCWKARTIYHSAERFLGFRNHATPCRPC